MKARVIIIIAVVILVIIITLVILDVTAFNRIAGKVQKSSFNGPQNLDPKFDCNCCGNCCRLIKYAIDNREKIKEFPEVKKLLDKFPYQFNSDGSCEMLINNKCSVYANRPDICNIKKVWKIAYKPAISLKEFYNLNKTMCNRSNDLIHKLLQE